MTETPPTPGAGPAARHATSVGQTGGLPGANADPATARLSEDELADTVNSGAPAEEGGAADDTADAAAGAGSDG